MNGIDANAGVTERTRELIVSSTFRRPGHRAGFRSRTPSRDVDPTVAARIFDPSHYTKSEGPAWDFRSADQSSKSHRGRCGLAARPPRRRHNVHRPVELVESHKARWRVAVHSRMANRSIGSPPPRRKMRRATATRVSGEPRSIGAVDDITSMAGGCSGYVTISRPPSRR